MMMSERSIVVPAEAPVELTDEEIAHVAGGDGDGGGGTIGSGTRQGGMIGSGT